MTKKLAGIGNWFKNFGIKFWNGLVVSLKRFPYFFYCLVHPFDGFYDLKNDPKRRNIGGAVILFILLAVSAVLSKQLRGYLFITKIEQLNVQIFTEMIIAVLPYLLWVISNWCFTSLMDGDGKLSDIFQATAVGTLPITICNLLLIPLSNFLNLDSSGIYYTISSLGIIIAYIIILLGMITTHQYQFGKGVATAILSILGILIILFVMILFFFLVQQVFGFVGELSTEINYRLNE